GSTPVTMEQEDEQEDALIDQAITRGGTIFSQADLMRLTGRLIKRVRNLTKTIDEHGRATAALQQKTNDLTATIKTLTVWLVGLTIAITVMTLIQASAAWKAFAGPRTEWVLWTEAVQFAVAPGDKAGFVYFVGDAYATREACQATLVIKEKPQ